VRKYKVYLDETIIWDVPDKPDIITDTMLFWELLQNGKYEIMLNNTMLKAHNPVDILDKIKYKIIKSQEAIRILSRRFSDFAQPDIKQVEKKCSINIAAALASESDYYVSWNYKGIVNADTIRSAKIIAMIERKKDLIICTPTMMIQ